MTGGTEDLEHTTTSDGDTPAGGSAVPPEESPDLVQTPWTTRRSWI